LCHHRSKNRNSSKCLFSNRYVTQSPYHRMGLFGFSL
jgi:hypothetical protein